MFKKWNSIRSTFIQSHIYGVLLTTLTVLACLLTIYLVFNPSGLNQFNIIIFTALYFSIGMIFAVFIGFKSSSQLKSKIDGLSIMIMQLSRGNYCSRMTNENEEEISRLGNELNTLAEKMDHQVRSLQRLADEKAAYVRTAHKAATIEERQRLARDLHDSVSQQLFALTMTSQACLRVVEKDQEKAKTQIGEIADMALKAQTEMRALLLHLRPVDLSGDSLTVGIEKLIEELQSKCAIHFRVKLDQIEDLAESVEEHIFRIIQEALSNTLRHAEASKVKVSIRQDEREVFIHLADNGKGFNVEANKEKKTSYGLKTMRERAEEIGGVLTIRSKEGEGTYTDIRIPYLGKEEQDDSNCCH